MLNGYMLCDHNVYLSLIRRPTCRSHSHSLSFLLSFTMNRYFCSTFHLFTFKPTKKDSHACTRIYRRTVTSRYLIASRNNIDKILKKSIKEEKEVEEDEKRLYLYIYIYQIIKCEINCLK